MLRKIEISHRTIIFTTIFLLGLWLVFQLRFILVTIFIALVLMSALNQVIDKVHKIGIPRSLSIILIYIIFIALFGLTIGLLIPPLVEQTSVLINRFPSYIQTIGISSIDTRIITDQINQLGLNSANVVKLGMTIVDNIINVIAILILTFYLLIEHQKLNGYLLAFFGDGNNQKAEKIIDGIEKNLGSWVGAQLILMTIIGVLVYIGLFLLGIDFALPLAIFAGLMEIVPNFGPIISGVPGVIIGFAVSPITGFATIALYFLVHQLENGLVVPKVMQKTIGFNPIITLVAIMVGFKLGGAMGALLAVPILLTAKVILKEISSVGKIL